MFGGPLLFCLPGFTRFLFKSVSSILWVWFFNMIHFLSPLWIYCFIIAERRHAESSRIREKYPDRVPVSFESLLNPKPLLPSIVLRLTMLCFQVIVEKAERTDVPDIDKKKYVNISFWLWECDLNIYFFKLHYPAFFYLQLFFNAGTTFRLLNSYILEAECLVPVKEHAESSMSHLCFEKNPAR